jgi:sialic acid synthase SpsE
MKGIIVGGREIGASRPPLVIAEIGINHEGDFEKAVALVDSAAAAGCECVKFQYHIVEEEMIPNDVVPGNAKETIWEIIKRCALSESEEKKLKEYVDKKGLIYLSTPFSREAANRLDSLGVQWFKIGSGECNNYPLIEHIAKFGKPILLSTGMNDLQSITPAVEIIRRYKIPYGLFHCTSLYPTPYDKVRLGALSDLAKSYPDALLGLSDHSIGIYTSLASVALGVSFVEKHFTVNKEWPGPDVPISINPRELSDLVKGGRAIYEAMGGSKEILEEEAPTIRFAYACVVSIKPIKRGDVFSENNIWVKRPGTGEILAKDFMKLIGKKSAVDIPVNAQLKWEFVEK